MRREQECQMLPWRSRGKLIQRSRRRPGATPLGAQCSIEVWYAVTLARVCLPFAYLADTCGDRFAARFPVGRLLAANVELASDPPAFCRVFMLALCVLSGLTLYGIVFYLCCFTSKLHARDIEAERQHRIMAARLKTDFEAAYDEHHRAMTDESRQNLEF
ncbi:unnamed protein product [Prorocentrum cordatum]|uniref:Protein S-acyltransferase n=1 Tax=Prorocentrum cordatum TaxID=2364126 RepID=A0ABN9VS92_9DINO|nr:unnamed protein product [Polarella glacialis]